MENKYYIGIDNGGSVSKVAVFDNNGNELAVCTKSTESITPAPGIVERDSEELFAVNTELIRSAITKCAIDPKRIQAVSVTGHGNGAYFVGKDGGVSYNGIISTDTRAANIVSSWRDQGLLKRMLPITNQMVWAGQTGVIVAWFAKNMPEVLERTSHVLSCTDYIRYKLTGVACAELTNMSVANVVDIAAGRYSDEIFEITGIKEYQRLFPPLVRSHQICGGITAAAAAQTGLIEGTPVAGGMVDVVACPIGTGVVQEEMLNIVTGTWSINTMMVAKPIVDENLFMSCLYPIDGKFAVLEGSMTSASNLEWFLNNLMPEEKQRMKKQGNSVYALCDEEVSKTKPEHSAIIYLPFLFGTNVDPEAKACFLGLSSAHGRPEMLRAIFEGVTFSTRYHVEQLIAVRGRVPKVVRIAGGPSRSPLWVQMFADVLNAPVEVLQCEELGALGTAISSAVGIGEFASYEQAVEKMVRVKSVFHPDSERVNIYDRKYALYKTLIQTLGPVWKKWNKL